ncbi:MAG: hypothetical protein KJ077_11115 [Anaerolineae bacterium]|nr:hypothetical protein [Anaerolineae bacterium]
MIETMTVREDRLKRAIFLEQDPEKQADLKRQLAEEMARPARVQTWIPPVDKKGNPTEKKYLLVLDRPTQDALAFLKANPIKDGAKPLELSWMARMAIQRFAQELGWKPPKYGQED